MTKFLTAEELLAAPRADAVTEIVDLPGLGLVKIRAFSKADHTKMLREAQDESGEINPERMEALALKYGLAEPELTLEQAQELREKVWGPVQQLLNRVWALSGMNTYGQVTVEAESFREG